MRCDEAAVGFDERTVLLGDNEDAETCDANEFLRSDGDITLSDLGCCCRDFSNADNIFRTSSLRFRNAIVSGHTTRFCCCCCC